ncbi:hypothetical protein PDIDSM_6105 [Penicillium digitatum]|nr:hypothetical protein PDIDSM_6105 [Penicillium digitatum]
MYARTNYIRPGNAREHSMAVTDQLAPEPKGRSWVQAAAVPVSAQTAWQGLFSFMLLLAREMERRWIWRLPRLLGLEGEFLLLLLLVVWVFGFVQLVTLLGAEVVGTCGARTVELVRSLGAKEGLNYPGTDLKE